MSVRKLSAWTVFWGAATLLSTAAIVHAFNPQPDPPGHYYGMMSLPAVQKISLHVSNTKMAVDAFRPEASTCVAKLSFVNACGETLAQDSARIMPSESMSLNFTVPAELPPDPCADPPGSRADPPGVMPARLRVRAQVTFTGLSSFCVSSVEVGDPFVGDPTGLRAGGAFVHPAIVVGFNPQPDPPKIAK